MKKKNKKLFRNFILITILAGGNYLYLNRDDLFTKTDSDYSEKALSHISKNEIKEEILKNDYSVVLNKVLEDDTFDEKYLADYYKIENQTDKEFSQLVKSLLDLGYNTDEINLIFKKLTEAEVKTMTEKNYLQDITDYLEFDYFIPARLERYKAYEEDDLETKLTFVNADLDYDFYDAEAIKIIENPNDNLVLLNKFNKIDESFSPALVTISKSYSSRTLQVKNEVKIAFEKMCDDARKENLELLAASTYRTYSYQDGLYERYAAQDGYAEADIYSARPGHSEHHTGLAIDVTTSSIGYGIDSRFDKTPEYNWLKDNAHKYGFIIRYPKGKEYITGYMAESWHIRYLNEEVATFIYENDLTFEEYYARYLLK